MIQKLSFNKTRFVCGYTRECISGSIPCDWEKPVDEQIALLFELWSGHGLCRQVAILEEYVRAVCSTTVTSRFGEAHEQYIVPISAADDENIVLADTCAVITLGSNNY